MHITTFTLTLPTALLALACSFASQAQQTDMTFLSPASAWARAPI